VSKKKMNLENEAASGKDEGSVRSLVKTELGGLVPYTKVAFEGRENKKEIAKNFQP
jgi:hypothetical protein